jgi:hypothetical protein
MSIYPLEGQPSDEQKRRLEDWLTELKIISRKYRILLDTEQVEEGCLIDLDARTIIGIGITYFVTDDHKSITGYDATGSILDGVWLIDTPDGPREQRDAGRVWPRHESKDTP